VLSKYRSSRERASQEQTFHEPVYQACKEQASQAQPLEEQGSQELAHQEQGSRDWHTWYSRNRAYQVTDQGGEAAQVCGRDGGDGGEREGSSMGLRRSKEA